MQRKDIEDILYKVTKNYLRLATQDLNLHNTMYINGVKQYNILEDTDVDKDFVMECNVLLQDRNNYEYVGSFNLKCVYIEGEITERQFCLTRYDDKIIIDTPRVELFIKHLTNLLEKYS